MIELLIKYSVIDLEKQKKKETKLLLSTCLLATLEVQRENLFLYSVLFVVLIVVIISNPFREINVSGHSKSYKHSQCKHNTILCASNLPIQWKAIQICMACEWCLLNTVSAIIMEQKLIHMLRNFFFCVLHVHTNSLQCTQKFIAQHKHVASRIITPISQTVVLPGIRFCVCLFGKCIFLRRQAYVVSVPEFQSFYLLFLGGFHLCVCVTAVYPSMMESIAKGARSYCAIQYSLYLYIYRFMAFFVAYWIRILCGFMRHFYGLVGKAAHIIARLIPVGDWRLSD